MQAMQVDGDGQANGESSESSLVDISRDDSSILDRSSIVSNDSISDSLRVGSTKKIKLTKQQREEDKARREAERERVRLEKEKAKAEKERERKEREQKAKEDRERKEREAKERQQKKEAESLKREEEKRKKELEKEEEKKKKEDERKKKELEKEEEKKKKEEERRKKEEERLKAKEAKEKEKQLAGEMEKKKLEKSQAVLFNFLKKPQENGDGHDSSANSSPIKWAMQQQSSPKPNKQVELSLNFDRSKFESELLAQSLPPESLHLDQLLKHQVLPKRRREEQFSDDVLEELPEHILNLKCTFLQFGGSNRPAYFGKRHLPSSGSLLSFQNPLGKDEAIDYDVNSELEWEEGEPGESLSNDEEEEEDKDDYEIDNEFFVPHGYLSDEEGDEEGHEAHAADLDGAGGEHEKQRSLLKEQTLMAERSHRFAKVLIPQAIGCIWEGDEPDDSEKATFLKQFARVSLLANQRVD